MANLYTKTGDKGTTGLVGGNRVSKSDPRVNCYGIIDEAMSMLGLAFASTQNEYIRNTVSKIQRKLFTLGAELASDEKGLKVLGDNVLQEEDITDLEKIVDSCTEITGKMTCFVVPGVDQASAALHCARTIVRRAERAITAVKEEIGFRDVVVRYVNRLSDAIFALARLEETEVENKELVDQITRLVVEELAKAEKKNKKLGELDRFDLETAKKMAALAEKKSVEIGVPMVFSAVDSGGNLILLHRMEGSLPGSLDVSMNKAYTANAFHASTDQLAKLTQPGGELYGLQNGNNGRVVIFGGGFPIIVDGKYVGGIGVSGGTVDEDMAMATYALENVEGGI